MKFLDQLKAHIPQIITTITLCGGVVTAILAQLGALATDEELQKHDANSHAHQSLLLRIEALEEDRKKNIYPKLNFSYDASRYEGAKIVRMLAADAEDRHALKMKAADFAEAEFWRLLELYEERGDKAVEKAVRDAVNAHYKATH